MLCRSGSMITSVSKDWLSQNKVRPIKRNYSYGWLYGRWAPICKAASNTDVFIEGVVPLDFSLVNDSECMSEVLFLVTSQNIRSPVLGYNIIEHLVLNDKSTHLPLNLRNSLLNASLENTKNAINLTELNSKTPNLLEEIKFQHQEYPKRV